MTTLDDTRHCHMCEDAAKKILELEQRVKVLTDALTEIQAMPAPCEPRGIDMPIFNQWAKTVYISRMALNFKPSPETDLDEALRRQ